MKRTTKTIVGVSLAALMVMATAAVAIAAPMLTLSATPTVVTYPKPAFLKLNASDGGASVATTVTVQYRPVGTGDWKYMRTVSASRTAQGLVTVPVSPYLLRSTTAFRATASGLESNEVTVSVKARLSRAIARSKVKVGKRVTVKGFIWPRHARGSRPVEVKFWKWESGDWVYKGSLHPRIVGLTGDGSKWQFTRRAEADDKGKWRMQVLHEDEKHVASTSRYSYIRVR